MKFFIRYSGVNGVLLRLMGLGRRYAYLEVDSDVVRVRMGWAFQGSFHVRSVVGIGHVKRVWSWGAHGWRGRWIVNGSGRDLLTIQLDPPERGRVTGIPVKLRELLVSLEDEKGFLRAIGR